MAKKTASKKPAEPEVQSTEGAGAPPAAGSEDVNVGSDADEPAKEDKPAKPAKAAKIEAQVILLRNPTYKGKAVVGPLKASVAESEVNGWLQADVGWRYPTDAEAKELAKE